jgi:hypothetical protein
VNVSALGDQGNDLPARCQPSNRAQREVSDSRLLRLCSDDTLETLLFADEQVICVNHHISG